MEKTIINFLNGLLIEEYGELAIDDKTNLVGAFTSGSKNIVVIRDSSNDTIIFNLTLTEATIV